VSFFRLLWGIITILPSFFFSCFFTLRISDLDKLNLVKVRSGGSVLDLSQFSLLPQLPLKMTLDSKMFKRDEKNNNNLVTQNP